MDFKFSGKLKDWELCNGKFLTNFLDNRLELVPDYTQLFFDVIQASHQPGGCVTVPPPPPPDTAPESTPATARRLQTGGPRGPAGAGADAHRLWDDARADAVRPGLGHI